MQTISTLCGIAATCAYLTTPSSGLAGDIDVPADHATIQAAVDAASDGDTIHIAPGVYVEQTFISSKNLTLTGQPGTILRAFVPGMVEPPAGGFQWPPIVYVHGAADVTLQGLTFEGDQLADPAGGLFGAYYLDAGGTVENCRFTGFRGQTPSGHGSMAMRFVNDLPSAPLYSLRVIGNQIEDSYSGMWVQGPADGTTKYDFVIASNTIRGVGPYPFDGIDGMRGIDLGSGISGSVVGNTISDFGYNGCCATYPFAWGLIAVKGYPPDLLPLQSMRIENNTFRNNNLHMVLLRADNNVVRHNVFEGTAPSQRMAGIWFSGTNVVVEENVFEDMETGIRVGGNDPDFGTALGIAKNAMLVDNRFCNVGTNIEVQPLATTTEMGTLNCPDFPDPVLKIVLLWPGIEEDFSVQSAPTSSGPWSTLDAIPVLQDGQNSVVVPADSEQQFFRLAK